MPLDGQKTLSAYNINAEDSVSVGLRMLGGGLHEIESTEEYYQIVEQNRQSSFGRLLVVFFHVTWCPPCVVLNPKFQHMSEEYPDVEFAKVDCDDCAETAEVARVETQPTFQFYKQGKLVGQVRGTKEEIVRNGIIKYKGD